jgi:hypothetical protein
MEELNQTAWITSCKLQESGYLINGNMSVPNDPANRHYVMVQEWIAEGNTPEPYIEPVPTYQELRASAYPPAADYLDAIVKGDTAQAQAYIDECLAVKAKYPK